MKHLFFLIALALLTTFSFAQNDCPTPQEVSYKKVMSSAFAKDYEKCPIIINAEYFGEGFMKNLRKPNKIKSMYFFQCVNVGDNGKPAPMTNEMSGDYFVIDKNKADEVLDLKKGDKLKLTGTTFTQNYFGVELSVFFIVTKVEKNQ